MSTSITVRVWDLPTRLFHWSLVALVLAAFVTIKTGRTDWHFYCGYAICTLLGFRIVWGIVGGRYARFANFLHGPGAVLAQLRGDPAHQSRLGHSPLGSLSVWVLLLLLLFQVGTGLFANDDIASEGPLARHVSNALSSRLTSLHHANEPILLGFIGLHIVAILAYRVFARRNLVGPMLRGDVAIDADGPDREAPVSRDDLGLRLLALGILILCGLGVAWLVA